MKRQICKRLITLFLVLVSVASTSALPALAAPVDKIMNDPEFLAAFDLKNAIILPYDDGEKTAVAIPSNAHYADYASEGFWFYWDAKQKDSGYAVLSKKFFALNESLILTVKSSNVYKNVTITQPGTYFIDQFLLKNEKKGPEGGYHNINWIGFQIVKKNLELELDIRIPYHDPSQLYPGAQIYANGYLSSLGSLSACAEITTWGIYRFSDHYGNPYPEPIRLPASSTSWIANYTPATDNSFIVYDQASAEVYLDYYLSVPEIYRDRVAPPIMYGKLPEIQGQNETERVFLFYPGTGDYCVFDDTSEDASSDYYSLRHFDSFRVDLEFFYDTDGPNIGNEWQGAAVAATANWRAIGSTSQAAYEESGISGQLFNAMVFFGDSQDENPLYSIQWFLQNFYFYA